MLGPDKSVWTLDKSVWTPDIWISKTCYVWKLNTHTYWFQTSSDFRQVCFSDIFGQSLLSVFMHKFFYLRTINVRKIGRPKSGFLAILISAKCWSFSYKTIKDSCSVCPILRQMFFSFSCFQNLDKPSYQTHLGDTIVLGVQAVSKQMDSK